MDYEDQSDETNESGEPDEFEEGPDSPDDDHEVPGGGTGSEPEASDSLRTFGAFVQAMREHAGLTRKQFGDLVGYSKYTVASVEQGRRMPPEGLVEGAEDAFGNTGAFRKAAPHLSRNAGLAWWFRRWAQVEKTAISLYTYECRLVPGLLQTEAYARAVALDVPPMPDPKKLEQRIAARLARQKLLSVERTPPTAFNFIIEQAVLERGTGGPEVTRELFDHILEVVERNWNVEIQIMPRCSPSHAGLDGPLQLAETPAHRWFAYSEGQKNGRLITAPKEISVLQQRYAKLRSQALSPEDSVGLLKRLRGAL